MEDIALRHVQVSDDRGVGQTYRLMLRAVMFCSERPNFHCLIIFGSRPALNHALEQARMIITPLQGFALVSHSFNTVSFHNGSEVRLVVPDNIERLRGYRINDFALDNSFRKMDAEIADWLRTILKPN